MNAIRTRSRLDPDAPAAAGTAPMPPLPALETIDQVHAALAEVDMLRIDAQRIVEAEAAAETALIDADAPDAEFAKLTMRTRSARRTLARLDKREVEILARAQAIEDARRAAQWSAFRSDYIEAAAELARVANEAEALRDRVFAIVTAAQRAGFGNVQEPPMPAIYGHVDWKLLTLPDRYAATIPTRPPAAPPLSLGPTLLVELVKPHGSMRIDAIHRVPAERAKWLVEQGIAALVADNPWGVRPDPDVISGKREA